MANFASLAGAGTSIERLLNACFADEQPISDEMPATAALITTEDFQRGDTGRIPEHGVSIYFYRVDVNPVMRAAWSSVSVHDGRPHLPLDLRFLLTAWSTNAEYELQILGRALQCLDTTSILSGPLLNVSADWAPNEAVQILIGEISTEEVMRTFDSLPHDYKLSVPYIARVIRIDGREAEDTLDVMTAITGASPSSVL